MKAAGMKTRMSAATTESRISSLWWLVSVPRLACSSTQLLLTAAAAPPTSQLW